MTRIQGSTGLKDIGKRDATFALRLPTRTLARIQNLDEESKKKLNNALYHCFNSP